MLCSAARIHLPHARAALAPQQFKVHPALAPLTLVLAHWYPARIARRVLASASHLNISPQIALSAVAAAAALVRFLQWKRLDASNRDSVWRFYGVFTCASFVGNVCGVAAWSFYLAAAIFYIDALSLGAADRSKSSAELASNYRMHSAFIVFKVLAFVFVSMAKLLVLDRMTQFVVKRAEGALAWRIGALQRGLLAIVIAVNVVAVAASLASAHYFSLAAAADASAATAFTANQSDAGLSLLLEAKHFTRDGNTSDAVSGVCIVAALVIIMAAFVGAGVFVSLRIRNVLAGVGPRRSTPVVRSTKYLLMQTCITVAVVFATFLLRTTFEMLLLLGEFSNLSNSCAPCESCQSVFYLIKTWSIATPEVQAIVVALAEPFSLLVALWGMTSERAAQLLNNNGDRSGEGVNLAPLPMPKA